MAILGIHTVQGWRPNRAQPGPPGTWDQQNWSGRVAVTLEIITRDHIRAAAMWTALMPEPPEGTSTNRYLIDDDIWERAVNDLRLNRA